MADPDGPQTMHGYYLALQEGRWDKEYVDSIGQMHRVASSVSWPMEQVAAFADIHAMIGSGLVAVVPVSTAGPPHRDSARQANADALADLPHPFTASVDMDQHNGDFDGMVRWSEPIEVSLATGLSERQPDGYMQPISAHYMIPPGAAPLEIGSSAPSRTWMHLVGEGGTVARWPYGHSCFRLFVNLDYMNKKNEWAESWDALSPKEAAAVAAVRERNDQAARRACAALGHPRSLTLADIERCGGELAVPSVASAALAQGTLW